MWAVIDTDLETAEVNYVEPHATQEAAIQAAVRDAVIDGFIKDTPADRATIEVLLKGIVGTGGSYTIGGSRVSVIKMGEAENESAGRRRHRQTAW